MVQKYYTVYNKKTDEIVVSGTSKECAQKWDKSLQCFYSIVSKNRKGIRTTYEIVVEDLDDSEKERIKQTSHVKEGEEL